MGVTVSADKPYAFLLRLGIMPNIAAEAIRNAGEPQPAQDQTAEITPADIERARTNWYFSDLVPEPMRRILDARSE